jgi:hypothetical protein
LRRKGHSLLPLRKRIGSIDRRSTIRRASALPRKRISLRSDHPLVQGFTECEKEININTVHEKVLRRDNHRGIGIK